MRATKSGSILVVLLFSAVLVPADFCRCADDLITLEMGHGRTHTTSGYPCGQESEPPSPCPSHYFHAVLGNLTSFVSGNADTTQTRIPVGTITRLFSIAAGPPIIYRSVNPANPTQGSRPIFILNATLLL